ILGRGVEIGPVEVLGVIGGALFAPAKAVLLADIGGAMGPGRVDGPEARGPGIVAPAPDDAPRVLHVRQLAAYKTPAHRVVRVARAAEGVRVAEGHGRE